MSDASLPPQKIDWRTPVVVIIAGCLIAMIGFGIRSTFGLFLEPMTVDRGWDRETFGLALAIQNLLWGLGVPIAGMIADKYGPSRVMIVGALCYFAGVYGMAEITSASALHLFAGVLTGIGVAFTSFSLAMAAMAKVVGPERRSIALGLGTAAGSFGQVVFSPLGQYFIATYGWEMALLLLAASAIVIIPLALILPRDVNAKGEAASNQTMSEALAEATTNKSYILLTTGFFVCGFHVAFITVHFPAYISDLGLDASVGANALALIGLFNIAGSFGSGVIGQKWSKRSTLSSIYALRAAVIMFLLLSPPSPMTIYIFAGAMGLLWLSTVPLTTGIVAQVFGARYMATLYGIVFLSHQLGSFLGVWLGGYLYDNVGSYDGIWWAGVALGVAAAIIHLPINEKPLARLSTSSSS